MERQIGYYGLRKMPGNVRTIESSLFSSEQYQRSVVERFKSERVRKILSLPSHPNFRRDQNIFALLHLQESGLLREYKFATRDDLERAVREGFKLYSGEVSWKSVPVGLSIRKGNLTTPNDFFIPAIRDHELSYNIISSQLEKRQIKIKKGLLLPFSELTLKEEQETNYGLTVILKENFDENSILPLKKYRWKTWYDRRGISIAFCGFDRKGERTWYYDVIKYDKYFLNDGSEDKTGVLIKP